MFPWLQRSGSEAVMMQAVVTEWPDVPRTLMRFSWYEINKQWITAEQKLVKLYQQSANA